MSTPQQPGQPQQPQQPQWRTSASEPVGLDPRAVEQGWITEPPPQPNTVKKVVGWILIVFGALGVLSMMSRAGRGELVLIYPDLGATLGSLFAVALVVVLPLWAGFRLKNSHRRAMSRWRDAEIRAEDARAGTLPNAWHGLPSQNTQYPTQQYPTQQQYPQQPNPGPAPRDPWANPPQS